MRVIRELLEHRRSRCAQPCLYRTIEELPPTVLFDEMDMHKLSKVAKGILNSGYKSGAFVAIMDGRRSRRLHT